MGRQTLQPGLASRYPQQFRGSLVTLDDPHKRLVFFIPPTHLTLLFIYLEKLSAETPTARDEMTILTLPYAVIPHRVCSLSTPLLSLTHFTVRLRLRPSQPLQPPPRPSKSLPSTSPCHKDISFNLLSNLSRSILHQHPLLQCPHTSNSSPHNNRCKIIIRCQKRHVPNKSPAPSTSITWSRHRRHDPRRL